jgi:fructoselysine 6-kinase
VHGRRCGLVTGYLGALGSDVAGRAVLSALREEDVDTSLVRVVDGPNAYAVVRVVDGNRVFGSGDPGVSQFQLSAADLDAASRAGIVHTGECSMLEDQLAELSGAAQRLSYDFSERSWEYIASLAPLVDVAIRSGPDLEIDEAVQQARQLQALGPQTVAITLGSAGAVVAVGRDVVHARSSPVDVLDTLGAGDAFIGRLLTGLLRNQPLAGLVARSTGYASRTCTSYGAFGHQVETSYRSAPLDPVQSGGVDPS